MPLAGVCIDADISSFCARVSVTQRFVNRETTPIEAVYVFPLDEGAAVCGFEAIIDGTLVVGEVKERDEAFRMYSCGGYRLRSRPAGEAWKLTPAGRFGYIDAARACPSDSPRR